MIGIKAGEKRTVKVDVPAELSEGRSRRQGSRLRRQGEVGRAPGEIKIDDEFAKPLGMESLAKLARCREGAHRARARGQAPQR